MLQYLRSFSGRLALLGAGLALALCGGAVLAGETTLGFWLLCLGGLAGAVGFLASVVFGMHEQPVGTVGVIVLVPVAAFPIFPGLMIAQKLGMTAWGVVGLLVGLVSLGAAVALTLTSRGGRAASAY